MADDERPCILLVEDHDDTLRMMRMLLKSNGYGVREARTFNEAAELAATGECKLVVSDICLVGQSGLELMKDLKSRHGLKGIAVSAAVSQDHRDAARLAGFDRFIAKPFDFSVLLTAIEELASTVA